MNEYTKNKGNQHFTLVERVNRLEQQQYQIYRVAQEIFWGQERVRYLLEQILQEQNKSNPLK